MDAPMSASLVDAHRKIDGSVQNLVSRRKLLMGFAEINVTDVDVFEEESPHEVICRGFRGMATRLE